MTEAERQRFFALASSRGPGKRQIKPNTNVLLDSIPLTDSDEDDDFVAGKTDSELSDSNEDSESDSSSSSESDGGDGGDGDKELSDSSESNSEFKPDTKKGQLICTLCLNQRVAVKNDEVIQCDRCGVAVHENCYITENPGDADSNGSSSSTEPWFCEPCLYGLKEPPYCELCPNRFGAFKKSDIGGGWVHLLCALYTPGITFGDVDRLSAISWQEIDYKLFGKRACVACSDSLLARTGIAVPCDAALCKNHFHVTCAQKLGLLVDNTEGAADPNLSNSSSTDNKNLTAYSVEAVDPLYLTCKRHANENLMKQRKAACSMMYKQEESRMLRIRRRALNEREERKREQMLGRHKKAMKDLEGITIAWPEHDNKRPRLFHTSAHYLELFAEKAESNGTSRKEFLDNFVKVNGAQLSYLPPGFSREFIEYFNHREKNFVPEETRKLETVKQENEKLRMEQKKLQDELHKDPSTDSGMLQEWYETLHALGLKRLKKPVPPIDDKLKKKMPKKSQSVETVASPSTSILSLSTKIPAGHNTSTESDAKTAELVDLKINCCDKCKKTTEQHLMTLCDNCHKYYHLACLEPPLLKMPKRTNKQGWMCSLCCEVSSDSDDEKVKTVDNSPRKLRDRSLASKKRKEEEKAERKAFRAAILSRRSYHKRPRKNAAAESGLQPSPDIADGSASSRDSVAVAASNSAPSITTAVRKRRSPDRTRRKTVGDCNGILQNNNMVAKKVSIALSPVTPVHKRKRRSSVNSLPPSLPKFKSTEAALPNEIAQT